MKISINEKVSKTLPQFDVIAYTFEVVNQSTIAVSQLLSECCVKHQNDCALEDVVNMPKIKKARDAYKLLGKDPSRYRLACEALLRRVIKRLDLYRINDLVDLGNILSLETSRSICVVDYDKIIGDVVIRQGLENEPYEAIGRGPLNIYKMMVYADDIGPFGSPTSDTIRTAITENTKKILVMMMCFDQEKIIEDEKLLCDLYINYANAQSITKVKRYKDE